MLSVGKSEVSSLKAGLKEVELVEVGPELALVKG